MRQSSYIPGNYFLHKLNPLTKLVGAVSLFFVAFASSGLWIPGLIFFLLIIPLALTNGLMGALYRALRYSALVFVILLFLIHGMFNPNNQTILFKTGWLVFYQEGFLYATLISLRVLASLGAGLLFMFSTHPGRLMTLLEKKGMPTELSYIIGSTLQIIPQIQARAGAIQEAQRARGLETKGNIFVRLRAIQPLLIPLLLGSLMDVEERAMALDARAFRSGQLKSSLAEIPDPVLERVGRWLIILFSVGTVLASRLI